MSWVLLLAKEKERIQCLKQVGMSREAQPAKSVLTFKTGNNLNRGKLLVLGVLDKEGGAFHAAKVHFSSI